MALALALCLGATRSDAQVAVGDSLWRLGRIDDAVAAYRRALEEDRLSVRANYRLSQTLAWSSNIDSALVLLRTARSRVPDDPDLLFTEATYLSWGKRFAEAVLRFDSLGAAHPDTSYDYVRVARARTLSWDGRLEEAARGYEAILARDAANRDAAFGLAQVSAWSGDLDAGAARYERLLASDSTEVRTLVGLGNLRLWQQRPGDARRLLARAVAADSANQEVKDLQRAVASAVAVRAELSTDYSEDSDRNVNRWQSLRLHAFLFDRMRAGLTVAQLAATDPGRIARRTLVEGSLGIPVWRGSLTAVASLRQMSPGPLNPGGPAPPDRDVVSGRLTLAQRVTSTLGVAATISRWPFDEIASITPLALDITQADLSADWRVARGTTVSASLGLLDWSDGNQKRTWSARATRQLPRNFSAGAFITGFGFDSTSTRYFSPAQFISGEATGGWTHDTPRWSAGLGAGLGGQRVGTRATQSQWHADARLERKWTARWSLEARAARSNSLAATAGSVSSAVGAYAYSTLGLSVRRSF